MSTAAATDADRLINVAIPEDAHKEMKRESAARGMKLREYLRFLHFLSKTTTAKQQRDAFEKFRAQREEQLEVA